MNGSGQISFPDSPTQKQLDLIESITEVTGYGFHGTTKDDASKFISAHIDEFKLNSTNNWALEHGYF